MITSSDDLCNLFRHLCNIICTGALKLRKISVSIQDTDHLDPILFCTVDIIISVTDHNDVMNSEIRFLEEVGEKLKTRITEINALFLEGEKQIESMQDYYWENYTEMDEYGYENYDNKQALLGEVNANNERLMKKQRLKKMIDSPYFGRVDFLFEGEEESESFYIGIGILRLRQE